jgi:hypothetical protein
MIARDREQRYARCDMSRHDLVLSTTTISLESRVRSKVHARFAGGGSEKGSRDTTRALSGVPGRSESSSTSLASSPTNGTEQKSSESRAGLRLAPSRCTSFHTIRYGIAMVGLGSTVRLGVSVGVGFCIGVCEIADATGGIGDC